jgi:hypothetical protein
MIESNLNYAEQFVRKWQLGTDWVSGTEVWNKFIEWLELKSIDAKFAGAYNKFYDKISPWLDRRRVHGCVQYKANENLIRYIEENSEANCVDSVEEAELDAFLKPVEQHSDLRLREYDPTTDKALLDKARELTPKISRFEMRHQN